MENYLKTHFKVTSTITESCLRLRLSEVAVAMSCNIYHACWYRLEQRDMAKLDTYLLACTSTYLASKFVEEAQKIRDVVIVFHRVLHKDKPPLCIGKRYWQLRDSVVQCELLLLRLLKFEVPSRSPQQYLVHFLQSLEDWAPGNRLKESRIPQVAWNLLHDAGHLPLCLQHGSAQVALATIYMASVATGCDLCPEPSKLTWWEALHPGIGQPEIATIGKKLLKLYEYEEQLAQ